MNIQIRQAHLEDLRYLAPRLRDEDRQEVETATGRGVFEALERAWILSDECYVARLQPAGSPVDPHPFLVFGVGPHPRESAGVIWMLSTPEIARAGIKVTRWARQWISAWRREYGLLTNMVDLRNRSHVRWLEILGATFGGTVELNGFPFRFFWLGVPQAHRIEVNHV